MPAVARCARSRTDGGRPCVCWAWCVGPEAHPLVLGACCACVGPANPSAKPRQATGSARLSRDVFTTVKPIFPSSSTPRVRSKALRRETSAQSQLGGSVCRGFGSERPWTTGVERLSRSGNPPTRPVQNGLSKAGLRRLSRWGTRSPNRSGATERIRSRYVGAAASKPATNQTTSPLGRRGPHRLRRR